MYQMSVNVEKSITCTGIDDVVVEDLVVEGPRGRSGRRHGGLARSSQHGSTRHQRRCWLGTHSRYMGMIWSGKLLIDCAVYVIAS